MFDILCWDNPPPYLTVYACKLKQSNVLVVKNTMSFIVCTFNLLSLCHKCNAVFKHYVYFVSFTNMSYFFLGFLLGAIFPEVVNFNYAYVLGILFIFVWEVYYNRLPKQKCIITMQINIDHIRDRISWSAISLITRNQNLIN